MKNNKRLIGLVSGALVLSMPTALIFTSCKKDHKLQELKKEILKVEALNLKNGLIFTDREEDPSNVDENQKYILKSIVNEFDTVLEKAKKVNKNKEAESVLKELKEIVNKFQRSIKIGTKAPTNFVEALKSYIRTIENENLTQNLLVTDDSNAANVDKGKKFTTVESFNKFKNAMDKAKLIDSELEAEKGKKILEKAVDEFKNSIKIGTKELNPPIGDNGWHNKPETVNGISFNGYGKIASILNLDANKTTRENLQLIKNTSKDKDVIEEVKVLAYDEFLGTITISAKIKHDGQDLGIREIEMTNFKTFTLPKEHDNTATIKINILKLIKEKKVLKDIPNNNLQEYIDSIDIVNQKGNVVSLLDLLKNTQYYSIKNGYSLVGNNKNELSFTVNFAYKKLEKGQGVETVVNKEFDYIKKPISNPTYDNVDVLDYIISTAKIKSDLGEKHKTFASSKLTFFRQVKKNAHFFVDLENEDYFGDPNIIEFTHEEFKTNDIDGTIELSFGIGVNIVNENKDYNSRKFRTFKIDGYKKIDSEYIKNIMNIFINPNEQKGQKLLEILKKEYNNDVNNLGKVLDKNWIKQKLGFDNHIFVRTIDDTQTHAPKLEFRKNLYLDLSMLGDTQFENYIIDKHLIPEASINTNFEIDYLQVELESFKFNDCNNKKVSFELRYKILVHANDLNHIDITCNTVISSHFMID